MTNNPCVPVGFSVLERVVYKAKNDILELSRDEREYLQDLLINSYASRITRLDDELLMQEADELGMI